MNIRRTTDTKHLLIAYNDDTTDGYQTIVGLVTKDGGTIMLPQEYCYAILDSKNYSNVSCLIDGTKAKIERERKSK